MSQSPAARRLLVAIVLLGYSSPDVCCSAVALDALGLYLTKEGYGGAQLVHPENFYFLPIQSNGKRGNLVIDTGAPASLIFRQSLKTLALTESKTKAPVSGAFGSSREFFGLTTIKALTVGNCTLTNVPVTVARGTGGDMFSRRRSNGLLGLRELIKFGAILDLPNRLIYLRPSRPGEEVGEGIKSILLRQGFTPVPLSVAGFHLHVPGAAKGVPCSFLVDTGAYLTALDRDFASRAKIQPVHARLTAVGLGSSSGDVGLAIFPSLRIGNYEIKRGSASIVRLDPGLVGRGTSSEIAGLLGIDHLAMNSAIFDLVTGTLYLRPRSR
jgi:predicted aspartyl protease